MFVSTAVGTQYFLRMFYNIYKSQEMKEFLKMFYDNIYIAEEENPESHQRCEKLFKKVYIVTMNFMVPLTYLLSSAPIESFKNPTDKKPYVYRMEFPYDAQEPTKYLLTQIFSGWVGFSCVTMMTAEDGIMAGALIYAEERYLKLHQDLQDLLETSQLMRKKSSKKLSTIFKEHLIGIIKRQQIIDEFNILAENFLSFKAFMSISFATISLCSIAFQLATGKLRADDLVYIIWLCATCFELVLLGNFGQKYTDTAEKLGNMYYMCNWEQLMDTEPSKEVREVMKILTIAIFRCQKPVHITGMKFVVLSKANVMNALKTSMSYFMFLRTMEDASGRKS